MIRHHFISGNFSGNTGHSNVYNIYNTTSVINTSTRTHESHEILPWLSPIEPRKWHQDIRNRRVDNVGSWLLKTDEYLNWLDGSSGGESDGSALFCYGGPWVGKTYICSLVVDKLIDQAMGEDATVACFYFDFTGQEDQSPAVILGSVLEQVVSGLGEVPEAIVNAFQEVSGSRRLVLSEIVEHLRDILSSTRTFICIDALDECRARHRVKLLDSLNEILQGSPGARIFLTGRPHIRDEVEKHLAGRVATRYITPAKNDIIEFLRLQLRMDTIPEAMDESLKGEIIQNITTKFSEMFLLASLSIETILQEETIDRRRQKLRAMESGLDFRGAYEKALGRIKAQGGEGTRLGMAVLMWITHSKQPLKMDEICHATAIKIGSDDLTTDRVTAISTLLGYCQGLITIDSSTSTVLLIHPTLKGYLGTLPDVIEKAHSKMAEVCLTYLNFQHVRDLSDDPSPDPRGTPFLEYSSLYWGTHMLMDPSNCPKDLALQLLDQFDGHISSKLLWNSISWEFTIDPTPDRKPFSALHCSSYFGVADIAKDVLIKMDRRDVNQRDSAGMTPLIWAARYGHKEVMELLLREKHIQPDQQDTNYGRTALSWAAENGHVDVVRLLLGPRFVNHGSIGRQWGKVRRVAGQLFGRRYVNPDSSGEYGRTPLSFAAENGNDGIVKLLLELGDVNPNSLDTYGRTPLLWAARNGHEEVVKRLFERKDLNPDIPDAGYGQTPLFWAAGNNHERVVRLLLERENVDPNGSAESGRTPLFWAAENGHKGIVEVLLERDVKLNIRCGEYGQTPLSRASQKGREGVAKVLLGKEDVETNTRDAKFGRTPLSWAAGNGHEEVVKLLLEQEGVDLNNSSKSGRTPLWLAAANGHEEIVKLLLHQDGVHPDAQDVISCGTPLPQAAGNGYGEAVEPLLEGKDTNPDFLGRVGQKILLWASQNGLERLVGLLWEQKYVNPDTPDTKFGRTPLSWAAGNGHEGIVKLLLEWKDPNANIAGTSYGQTPLPQATQNGCEEVANPPLEQRYVNPDTPDTKFGRTPLSWASRNCHEGIVKLLLKPRGANANIAEISYGQTPLSRAAQNGHEEVVKLLLGQDEVKPDTPDTKFGRTPLSWAAGNGHEGIVKLLLKRRDPKANMAETNDSQTPLSWAAENRHGEIVKLLLKRRDPKANIAETSDSKTPLSGAAQNGCEEVANPPLEQRYVNPDTPDTKFGRTPLSWAAGGGHKVVVELLLKCQGVNPHSSSKSGRTPLLWAAENGHEGIVKLLLEQIQVNPDTPDVFGQTPLSWAARNGYEGVVELLLKRKDVDPNSLSKCGQTPLTLAAENGHDRVVELLRIRDPRYIPFLDPHLMLNS